MSPLKMESKMIKVCRIHAGEYEVFDTGDIRCNRKVRVTKVHYPGDGTYWIAAPMFDSNTSDPLFTKRDAVNSATYMLETYP